MNEMKFSNSVRTWGEDIPNWYDSEQCWNCDPAELQKMQLRKPNSLTLWFVKHRLGR